MIYAFNTVIHPKTILTLNSALLPPRQLLLLGQISPRTTGSFVEHLQRLPQRGSHLRRLVRPRADGQSHGKYSELTVFLQILLDVFCCL